MQNTDNSFQFHALPLSIEFLDSQDAELKLILKYLMPFLQINLCLENFYSILEEVVWTQMTD